MHRIYLDNAATSFPKPESVYQAVDDYQRRLGAASGRGAYTTAGESNRIVDQARKDLSRLLGAEEPNRIVFAFNGTDALNIAIQGLLRPGDHVVTTAAEHNSVLRPLAALAKQGVDVTVVDVDRSGRVAPAAVNQAFRSHTKLLILIHASNVTGTIQPVQECAEMARRQGIFTLLDAAQTAGHVAIDLETLPVDLLACPGHKGLLGPLGTGLLYLRPGLEQRLHPFRYGGTGTDSESEQQPAILPEMLESGNLNVAGIAGLGAGARWILDRGVTQVQTEMESLTAMMIEGLSRIEKVTLFGPLAPNQQAGLISLRLENWAPADLANVLDTEFGIETRAGLHCAPRIHQRLGTVDTGGTLRASLSPLSTQADVALFIEAIGTIASN